MTASYTLGGGKDGGRKTDRERQRGGKKGERVRKRLKTRMSSDKNEDERCMGGRDSKADSRTVRHTSVSVMSTSLTKTKGQARQDFTQIV